MEEIHQLNKMYRQVDRPTDVLSFPMIEDFNEIDWEDEEEEILLGDVVICLEQAQKQAEEYGHSQMREIVYLFVHSVLHLLGYRSYWKSRTRFRCVSRKSSSWML